MAPADELELRSVVARVVGRWPCAGVAAGVVRDGSLRWFLGHGVADAASRTPVTSDTVFRIASVTKTMTAVAVMQLWERGLLDLDAPASDSLRSFDLAPPKASFGPVTIRHLLTHTGGIGYWRRWSDLRHPALGSGDRAHGPVGTLADYYRGGLPVVIEPGTRWVYSNHGFAVLGQIVEDVTGVPIDRYLREQLFDPLGMAHTDLVRSRRVTADLATGHVLRRRGLQAVDDHDLPTVAAGGAYASARDVGDYLVALLSGGANPHGMALEPQTVVSMFEPHFQTDPRVPGMGLGFELNEEDGHRVAAKGGILSGFLSNIALAPDDGVGVFVLTNTGGLDGQGAAGPLATALLRRVLGLPDDAVRADVPARPEVWGELCGWYGMDPGPLANAFDRLIFGAGVEVAIRRGRLWFRSLSAIPALRRGAPLHPDDANDPYVFRLDLSDLGIGTLRVAFPSHPHAGRTRHRLEAGFVSLQQRPDVRNPRLWAAGGLTVGVGALALRAARGSMRSSSNDDGAATASPAVGTPFGAGVAS